MNGEEGFIHFKAWNPNIRLLRHSNTHMIKFPRRHREVDAERK
jgi:hypothetical protein